MQTQLNDSIHAVISEINMTNYEELKARRMEVIKSLFLSGVSTEEIIKKSGVSKATVYKYIKEMGIRPISFRQLCRDNGVDFNSVNSARKRYGLSFDDAIEYAKVNRHIKFEYQGGKGLPEIADKFDLSYNSLINIVYRLEVRDINQVIEIAKARKEGYKKKPKSKVKQQVKPKDLSDMWKLALGIRA